MGTLPEFPGLLPLALAGGSFYHIWVSSFAFIHDWSTAPRAVPEDPNTKASTPRVTQPNDQKTGEKDTASADNPPKEPAPETTVQTNVVKPQSSEIFAKENRQKHARKLIHNFIRFYCAWHMDVPELYYMTMLTFFMECFHCCFEHLVHPHNPDTAGTINWGLALSLFVYGGTLCWMGLEEAQGSYAQPRV